MRRMRTGLAVAGVLSMAVALGGCDVVNNILGRSEGRTAGAGAGFGGAGFGGGGFGGQAAALPVVTAEVARETVSSFLVATTTLTPSALWT